MPHLSSQRGPRSCTRFRRPRTVLSHISPVRSISGIVQKIKFKLAKLPSFPSDDVLYSWAVDNDKDMYRLSSTGIYRIANATDCKADCHAHPRKNVSPRELYYHDLRGGPECRPGRFARFAFSVVGAPCDCSCHGHSLGVNPQLAEPSCNLCSHTSKSSSPEMCAL